jgi:hypothetical protein
LVSVRASLCCADLVEPIDQLGCTGSGVSLMNSVLGEPIAFLCLGRCLDRHL